jgi:hypothetical protein
MGFLAALKSLTVPITATSGNPLASSGGSGSPSLTISQTGGTSLSLGAAGVFLWIFLAFVGVYLIMKGK